MTGQATPRRATGWRLQLEETCPGVWRWQAAEPVTLWPARQSGRNLFSTVGLGAESWQFATRPGQLTPQDALLYDGCHHFLSAVQRLSPRLERWDAARVWPVQATRTRYRAAPDDRRIRRREADEDATLVFPVIVTERYRSVALGEISASETHTLVAVTPKRITCQLHDVLAIDGRQYAVQVAHELDPWKNEYEITYLGEV